MCNETTTKKPMDLRHCAGCRNNFYNHNGIGCWMRPDAQVITRYEIHMDAPMNILENWNEVERPDCYQTGGYSGSGYAIFDEVSSSAIPREQAEAKEKARGERLKK